MIKSLPNVDTFTEEGWKEDNSIWNCIMNQAACKIYAKKAQESIANKRFFAL